jgi:L-threonylcarbamoyladenylate synthase
MTGWSKSCCEFMETVVFPADNVDAIPRALELLKHGGLIAFPTDTVYGVGALAFDAKAVESIYAAKDRPVDKAIPILIGGPEDLDKIAVELTLMAVKLAARFWPGALTLVVLKHPNLPDVVSATPTVGVRVPDHPATRALLTAAGPMAVTSANISGEASPRTAEEVSRQLNGRIPLILDGGETPRGVPSTVVNCLGTEPVILREGPITMEDIQFVLR